MDTRQSTTKDQASRAAALDAKAAATSYTPDQTRSGIALCLSGGGFRAALFHLGALRRLNELAILSKLDAISSVSGGSIISAHLAERVRPWPARGAVFDDWEGRVAEPFRLFTSKNLRTPVLLKRLLPWNWFRSSNGVQELAKSYEKEITRLKIHELQDRPRFIFCATDMAYGVNWTFEKARVGDYEAGYVSPPPPDWRVARAVAASSCFPPIFNPLPVELGPGQLRGGLDQAGRKRDQCIAGLRLTDGGNYDNMGLEPVWKTYQVVLVSDGGAVFEHQPDHNLFLRLSRYTDILGSQSAALRKRWLISNFLAKLLEGAYWGIGSATESYQGVEVPGYPKELVKGVIAEVRTDLDAFSRAEIEVLENHGYLLAEAAIRGHTPGLASTSAPLSIPHPKAMDGRWVERALAGSNRRTLLGRR